MLISWLWWTYVSIIFIFTPSWRLGINIGAQLWNKQELCLIRLEWPRSLILSAFDQLYLDNENLLEAILEVHKWNIKYSSPTDIFLLDNLNSPAVLCALNECLLKLTINALHFLIVPLETRLSLRKNPGSLVFLYVDCYWLMVPYEPFNK